MEWYYILLVTLFAFGGVIAVTVLCLHIFECSYVYRHRNDAHFDSSDFSFDISQTGSGQSTGAAREVSALPVNPGPEYMAARSGSVPSSTSPMSFLTFSDASSRSRTSLEDLNRELPVAPDRAHIKPPTMFLSFDKLRGKPINDKEVDLEAQNEKVGQQMRNFGW